MRNQETEFSRSFILGLKEVVSVKERGFTSEMISLLVKVMYQDLLVGNQSFTVFCNVQ